jgi:vacuolar-type H+-ATPase subunit I/STV1
MKWTTRHDVEFCKEIVASKLFETKKRSIERAQVWEAIAKKLQKIEYPKFKVEQRSVRDRLNKLIKQFRRKDDDGRRASGISPELTELDTLLEEICEKEEASETLAADMAEKEKRRLEGDQIAAQEMRKRAMESLSETQKRNSKADTKDGPKRKVRKGGDTALAFLAEKAENERKLKEESNRLERERLEINGKGKNRQIYATTE